MKSMIAAVLALIALSACGSTDTTSFAAPAPEATTMEAATSEPSEVADPGPLDHIPGDGTYEVGVDVLAGTYENDGSTLDGAPCVAVVSSTTDTVKGFIRASNTSGHGILNVEDGQYVISQFCQDWALR
jgi:hypothetical protein